MSKIKLALDVVEDLRALAASIEALTNAVGSNQAAAAETEAETPKEESITIEMVRAVLAEKSQSGKQPQVKALITKYGAKKLTDVYPACYPDLLKEAEAL